MTVEIISCSISAKVWDWAIPVFPDYLEVQTAVIQHGVNWSNLVMYIDLV